MADGVPPHLQPVPDAPRQPDNTPPPPLKDVRVKGPQGKGINKPAILVAGGGGLALVLLFASSGLGQDPARQPADTKPMMSDPARPEMAQSAVRDLPHTYPEAAARDAALRPAAPPLLGPPLPGDVAAFAPEDQAPREYGLTATADEFADPPADPAIEEAHAADRSQVFFALRHEPKPATASTAAQQPQNQLTGVSPRPQQDADRTALFPGTVISASLVTAINSESPGPVIAQVTQTVYDSATGRSPVIPQGARLIGDYKSSTQYGQSRIAILWSRLIMPDGAEIALNEHASDPSGAAGVPGKIDNHWGDVFGAAALGTIINIGVAATEDPELTYGGIGLTTRDPVDDAIAEGVQRGASIVTNRVVERSLAIPPTIRIEAGRRISVIVRTAVQL